MLKDNEKFAERLVKGLESVGLYFIEEEKSYRADTWSFNCKWMAQKKIALVWYKTFTENPLIDEDDKAVFLVDGAEFYSIDLFKMRSQRLDKSIYVHLQVVFKDIASKITGKGK